MDKSDIRSIARQQLSDSICNFQVPPSEPLQVSPWIAMSGLQKAIRRGTNSYLMSRRDTRGKECCPWRCWRRHLQASWDT
jgi:hypothetical protein